MPRNYQAYLQSPEWRKTRNAALKRAGYQCSGCPSRRELQVHHVTYERVGCEREADLVVLCAPCHEGEHPQEHEFRYVRRYLSIARELFSVEVFQTRVDFMDAVKARCARLSLPYNTEKLARAIDIVADERRQKPSRVVREFLSSQWGQPFSAEETRDILRKYGLLEIARSHQVLPRMAKVDRAKQIDLDRQKALRMVGQEIEASLARCAALENQS
jgi:hypothetical protein